MHRQERGSGAPDSHAGWVEQALERARAALRRVPELKDAALELVSVSENVVVAAGEPGRPRAALRVTRPGYRTLRALRSEIAWLSALEAAGIEAPRPLVLDDGTSGVVASPDGVVVVLSWIDGMTLEPSLDPSTMEQLGALAARLQVHARTWSAPRNFERWHWDATTMAGARAHWGDWQAAVRSVGDRAVIAHAVAEAAARLAASRATPLLVHSDLRAANVVRRPDGVLVPIDFDDAGFGLAMLDLAGSLSFLEHAEGVPEAMAAWLRGYAQGGLLRDGEVESIWPLVVLRRVALTGWVAARPDSLVAGSLASGFVEGTVELCERFVAGALATPNLPRARRTSEATR